jgi:fermentation-respiration switch protein FrsA (DUF1100 family)
MVRAHREIVVEEKKRKEIETVWYTRHDFSRHLMFPLLWLLAAGNMAFRLHFIKALARVLDCSVFITSYRGYGRSSGSPSEAGLKLDADAALRHLVLRSDIDPSKLVLFGRSLGGAVAIYAAGKHKHRIKGLIVRGM